MVAPVAGLTAPRYRCPRPLLMVRKFPATMSRAPSAVSATAVTFWSVLAAQPGTGAPVERSTSARWFAVALSAVVNAPPRKSPVGPTASAFTEPFVFALKVWIGAPVVASTAATRACVLPCVVPKVPPR
jgi:hypothetical protein